MNHSLAIVVNGTLQVSYDRDRPLPESQYQALDLMDEKMNSGITLAGEHIERPDMDKRAMFVASQLIQALLTDNEALIAASTSYLATRLTDLKQVRANVKDELISYTLVFDQAYAPESPVHFVKKG